MPLDMPRRTAIAGDRLRLLIEQMGAEMNHEHGWKTEVGMRLGISQSVMTRLISGERNPGTQTIDRVVQRLGIDSSFFYDKALSEPHYSRFIGIGASREAIEEPHVELDDQGYRVTEEFLASDEGQAVSDEHARILRTIRYGDYEATIADIRTKWMNLLAKDAGKSTDRSEPVKKRRPPGRVSLAKPKGK